MLDSAQNETDNIPVDAIAQKLQPSFKTKVSHKLLILKRFTGFQTQSFTTLTFLKKYSSYCC